jgi:hypothetical protein
MKWLFTHVLNTNRVFDSARAVFGFFSEIFLRTPGHLLSIMSARIAPAADPPDAPWQPDGTDTNINRTFGAVKGIRGDRRIKGERDRGAEEGRRDEGTEGRRDGGTEGRRDGGTEGRRDGGTKGRRDGGTEGAKDQEFQGARERGIEGRGDLGVAGWSVGVRPASSGGTRRRRGGSGGWSHPGWFR